MTMFEAIKTGFANSLIVEGRASRPEFWWFWGFHLLIPVTLVFVVAPALAQANPTVAQTVIVIGVLLYCFTVPGVFSGLIRRAHDVGHSAKVGASLYLLIVFGLCFLVVQLSQLGGPFDMGREFHESTGSDQNPAVLLVTGPLTLIIGGIGTILFAMIVGLLALTVGGPVLIATLALVSGLTKRSDPYDNAYGPGPEGAAPIAARDGQE